ncbi:MAG TPA: arginine--tRNA ligase, partial [Pirellulales bacterium]
MNLLAELGRRVATALEGWVENGEEYAALVRRSQDPKFGDYQVNSAMSLAKRLGKPPREVAQEIVARLVWNDLFHAPEIAGPGFINFRLRDEWLAESATQAAGDPRLGVATAARPKTYIVDYSSPNVAKPMHVGHIRSTVIGDSLYRTLKFLGHQVIGDNHLGDWGTQFGMIIYGYRHFVDQAAYEREPVAELARLYKLVRKLVDFVDVRRKVAELQNKSELAEKRAAELASLTVADPKEAKKHAAAVRKAKEAACEAHDGYQAALKTIAEVEENPTLRALAERSPTIDRDVQTETAKLHSGDPENLRLWKEFMPPCLEALEKIYRRLHVRFDETLGESFFHPLLKETADDLTAKGLARISDGALCVFVEGFRDPFIIQKSNGAFLYATTDLATIKYRMERWKPDAILYVVDHRQGDHFKQLFATARIWGYDKVELQHISFGTVLGKDGKPYKTRAGDAEGLEGLLDEAFESALAVVSSNDDAKKTGPELSAEDRKRIAEVVGIGAVKYADLSQNRESDYEYSPEKMVAMDGNTATYMQYAYARLQSIFAKAEADPDELRRSGA